MTPQEMYELYLEVYGYDLNDPPIRFGVRPDTPNAIFIEFESGEKLCFTVSEFGEELENA